MQDNARQRQRVRFAITSAVLAIVFALATPALAQESSGSAVAARIVPGMSFQVGRFGDDSPRSHSEAALTLGGQICMNRSAGGAVVVEATMPFNWLDNPHGGERVRSVPVLVGYQNGPDTYVRATIGITLAFWKAGRGRSSVEAGFAASFAVGRNFGSERWVATEGVLHIAATPGFFMFSAGGQVPIGQCARQ